MKMMTDFIRDRIYKENKNYMGIALGGVGTGKSYTCLRFCEKLDPNFSIDNVCFSAEEFLTRLRSPDIKKGSGLIMDEAGVSIGSRDFWSLENRRISYICQTFRHRNLIVFFTVPNLRYIDAQVRPLFSGLIQTKNIDFARNVCKIKMYWLESSPETGKIYKHFYKDEDGYPITWVEVEKPSGRLVEVYERKKLAFSDNLQERSLREIKKEREISEPQEPNITCPKCKYAWVRTGRLNKVKCPNCGHDFKRDEEESNGV